MLELINSDLIILDLEAETKNEVIEKMSQKLEVNERLSDYKGFIEQVYLREGDFPTSLGFNFAIPHGKCAQVKKPSVAFSRLKKEIEWGAEETAKYIFLIAVPDQNAGNEHLKILARLSRKIMDEDFRKRIETAIDIESMLKVLSLEAS